VVDTLDLVLSVFVHAANIQDSNGAKSVLSKLDGGFKQLSLIWADGGYSGKLIDWAFNFGRWLLQIVERNK